jgi:hypothetical protein
MYKSKKEPRLHHTSQTKEPSGEGEACSLGTCLSQDRVKQGSNRWPAIFVRRPSGDKDSV